MDWTRFIRRKRWDAERARELEAYIEIETDENIARGMTPAEGRAAARRKLGNTRRIREDIYDMNTIGVIESVRPDIRDAFRALARRPATTAVVVLTLALGIGANTAVFGIVDRLMLAPLQVDRPDTLVRLAEVRTETGTLVDAFAYPAYDRLRRESDQLSVFMTTHSSSRPAEITERGEYSEAVVQMVSDNYFEALGVAAVEGRVFREDPATGSETVAVISDAYWEKRYGRDRAAVGERFSYLERDFTIVGVAPGGFGGVDIDVPTEIWVPFEATIPPDEEERQRGRWIQVMGRLEPGATQMGAEAEADAILEEEDVRLLAGRAGFSQLRERMTRTLVLVEIVVVLIVLLACANLANLGMADVASREGELSVRRALGASRMHLARPLLVQGILVSAAGGMTAMVVARWMTAGFLAFLPPDRAPALANLEYSLDARLFGFTLVLSMATSILIGLGPSLSAMRPPSRYPRSGRTGRILVAGGMAVCAFLLVVAGLFVASVRNLRGQDAGYREEGLIVADVRFPRAYSETRRDEAIEQLRARLAGLAEVDTAAFSHIGQLTGGAIEYDVQADEGAPVRSAFEQRVSPGFAEAMGNRQIAGRDFDDRDDIRAPRVAIVTEAFAERLALGSDPLGRSFLRRRGDVEDTMTVVGVIADVKWLNLRDQSPAMYYVPYSQQAGSPAVRFAVRGTGDPDALAAALLSTAREVDPQMTVEHAGPFSRVIQSSVAEEQLVAEVSALFSLIGLLIAAAGLSGILGYGVARREREIGVRIAVGARPRAVEWLVVRESLTLAAIGGAIGIPAGVLAVRTVRSMLFGLTAADPGTIGRVVIVLMLATFVSAYVPARRAAAVDPMVVLKSD